MGETTAPMPPITAVYVRASSRSQDTAGADRDGGELEQGEPAMSCG
jgi:hypothetical protein